MSKIVALRTAMKDKDNKTAREKMSQAERLTSIEEKQQKLASLLYDVSKDLDDLRKILGRMIESFQND